LLIDIDNTDGQSVSREPMSDGGANAARSTSDDCNSHAGDCM
jgi:hypothetical protein